MRTPTPPGGPADPAGTWGARNLGSPFHYAVFHGLIRIGGRRAAYALLRVVVLWYVLFRPSVRRRTRPYLSRRFPLRTRATQRFADCYRMCLAYGMVLVDRAVLAILGEASTRVDFPDGARLRALLAEGRGLILVNSHVGCWQVAMPTLRALSAPVHLIRRPPTAEDDRTAASVGDGSAPIRTISPDGFAGGMVEATAALVAGEVVCVMGDRVLGDPGASVASPFLGADVRLPIAAYRMASATGAPVAVLYSHKTGPDSYRLQVAAALRPPPDLGRSPAGYRPWAALYVETLERYVREHPWQFFNFFDMWAPADDVRGAVHSGSP